MFTFIYAQDKVYGAEICLAGCIICLLLAYVIAVAVKSNRGKKLLRTFTGISLAAALCDLFWFLVYFPGGEYVNYGVGAVGGLIFYPICLAIGVAAVSYMNKEK